MQMIQDFDQASQTPGGYNVGKSKSQPKADPPLAEKEDDFGC